MSQHKFKVYSAAQLNLLSVLQVMVSLSKHNKQRAHQNLVKTTSIVK